MKEDKFKEYKFNDIQKLKKELEDRLPIERLKFYIPTILSVPTLVLGSNMVEKTVASYEDLEMALTSPAFKLDMGVCALGAFALSTAVVLFGPNIISIKKDIKLLEDKKQELLNKQKQINLTKNKQIKNNNIVKPKISNLEINDYERVSNDPLSDFLLFKEIERNVTKTIEQEMPSKPKVKTKTVDPLDEYFQKKQH